MRRGPTGNREIDEPVGANGKWAAVTQQDLGELIDAMGVRQYVDDGERVCNAVVLLTVEEPDGHMSLRCAWSDGMSWIERIGVLRAAERAELPADGAHDWRV